MRAVIKFTDETYVNIQAELLILILSTVFCVHTLISLSGCSS